MSYLIFPPPPPPPSPPFTAMTRPIFPRSSSSGATSFPIIAVAVIGILATGFLLVSYYIFVIKCCLNWHQIDIFRRRRRSNDQNSNYSPHELNKGLDESAIRAIPIFNFKKRNIEEEEDQKNSQECSVCLNEFQEDEKLRIIPNCCHMFHIDCIDVWLQTNANCPLCRTSVSCDTSYPFDLNPSPSSSPESNHPPRRELEPGMVFGGDNDFVVIELGNSGTSNGDRESAANRAFLAEQERLGSGDVVTRNIPRSISLFPGKFDRRPVQKNGKKLQNMKSMGDECIDTRDKDDQFGESVKPIRRSISMDSSADRELYLAVQEAINRKTGEVPVVVTGEECSSSSNRVKRCFFTFGSNRGSNKTSSVYLEP